MKLLTKPKQCYVVDFVPSYGVVFVDKDLVHLYLFPGKEKWDRKKASTAPIGLQLFAPVVKSKHNREGLRRYKFVIFVETVGCRDHPGASYLIKMKILGSTLKTHQGATALGVDVILTLVLVSDQSCYPGVSVLLLKCLYLN